LPAKSGRVSKKETTNELEEQFGVANLLTLFIYSNYKKKTYATDSSCMKQRGLKEIIMKNLFF